MDASTQSGVIFVGALPPPLSGQANINQKVLDALRASVNAFPANGPLVIVDWSPGSLQRSLLYHARRIVRVVYGVAMILLRGGRHQRLYLSVDSGLGLLYNLLALAAARLRRCSVFLHYHSFSCIDRHSRLMSVLVNIAGAEATHIFLGERMRDLFAQRYAFAGAALICSNARFIEPQNLPRSIFNGARPLRVGLLSNLCAEKGLYDFLDLLRGAAQRNLPICGVLAGPPVQAGDAAAIAAARVELGDRLDVRGAVYGDAKTRFYADIDVFVFPTRYRVEAQPVVLFEALAQGVPVVSFARGCIGGDIEAPAGVVVAVDGDFCEAALTLCERWLREPVLYAEAQAAAMSLSRKLHARAENGFAQLLAVLTAPPVTAIALQVRI